MPQLLKENEVSYYLGEKHIYPKVKSSASGMPIVSHGTSDTTYTLPPNEYHTWGEVSALVITLDTPSDNTIVNEYWFRFQSGSTPTNLSISPSVDFPKDSDLIPEANTIYEVHIVGTYAVWNEWEVSV